MDTASGLSTISKYHFTIKRAGASLKKYDFSRIKLVSRSEVGKLQHKPGIFYVEANKVSIETGCCC